MFGTYGSKYVACSLLSLVLSLKANAMSDLNFAELSAGLEQYLADEYKNSLKYLKVQKKERKTKVLNRLKTAIILHGIGLMDDSDVLRWARNSYTSTFNGEIKNTLNDDTKRKLKAAFGQCSEDVDSKCADEDSTTTIRIPYDMGKDYHGPMFYRIYTLQPDDPCQYKTETRTYTDTSLVCNVPRS